MDTTPTDMTAGPGDPTAEGSPEDESSPEGEGSPKVVGLSVDGEESSPKGARSPTAEGEQSEEVPYSTTVIPEGMSPHQWKIALRKKRRAIRKQESSLRRKERDKQKKEKRRLEKQRKAEESGLAIREKVTTYTEPKAKRKKMSDSCASDLRVAIDLSYDELMAEKDLKKVMHQCQRCYSANRRAEAPLQLYLTSFGDSTATVWDQQHTQYRSWDVHRRKEGYVELFGKENVVFLTSDSPNVLQDLDAQKVYIIGGLVDHNHQKGYCYQQALKMDIAHAQLPISQYVKLNCREVLAINHVFEILLEFSACRDWEKAFHTVIPPRKVVSSQPAAASATTSTKTETPTTVASTTSDNDPACAVKSEGEIADQVKSSAPVSTYLPPRSEKKTSPGNGGVTDGVKSEGAGSDQVPSERRQAIEDGGDVKTTTETSAHAVKLEVGHMSGEEGVLAPTSVGDDVMLKSETDSRDRQLSSEGTSTVGGDGVHHSRSVKSDRKH